jgi:hypothetical protein
MSRIVRVCQKQDARVSNLPEVVLPRMRMEKQSRVAGSDILRPTILLGKDGLTVTILTLVEVERAGTFS